MNKWLLMVGVMVFSVTGAASAEMKGSMMQDHPQASMKGSMKGSMHEAVAIGNKICPVSQEPVDEMGEPVVYEYKGMKINFCCKACVKDFKKNPEKYMDRLMKEIHSGVEGYSSGKSDEAHEHDSHHEEK